VHFHKLIWAYQMGVVDSAIWRAQKGGLRDALRFCRTNLCQCVADYIKRMLEDPHNGLINRAARALAGNAVSSQIPTHVDVWEKTQDSMNRANKLYEQYCGGGGPPHPQYEAYKARAFPGQAEWEAANGRPMPEYSDEYPPPLSTRIWNALPSARQVCVGTFTGAGGLVGGIGGAVLGGGGGAAGGTLVAPGFGTIGGGAIGAWEGGALGGAGGAALGYGIGDYLCR
jgi:hypothetical protein